MTKRPIKVARICWSTKEWSRPSGSEGKCKNKDSFENLNGFGHEEWLLDNDKILPDGYHYGFMEPVRGKSGKNSPHIGKHYDIHLFTLNPNGNREYVGYIEDVECLSPEQSKMGWQYYKQAGWLTEMEDDVEAVGLNRPDFTAKEHIALFVNVRFKVSNEHINFSNRPVIPRDNPNIRGMYYRLMDYKGEFPTPSAEGPEDHVQSTDPHRRKRPGGTVEIDPRHMRIEEAVYEILKKEYAEVYREDGHVDIKAKTYAGKYHFFEIKTDSAKKSIREALGQILEYVHYPNHNRAEKMIIIGPKTADESDKKYLQLLREIYGLPVWFRYFDIEKKVLEPEV